MPRILCWVLCDLDDLDKHVRHVKARWAPHCDITLYSSKTNHSFPTIGLNVPKWPKSHRYEVQEGEDLHTCTLPQCSRLLCQSRSRHVPGHPQPKALSVQENPDRPEYFGHRLKLRHRDLKYDSGGAGIVLSSEAMRGMVEIAFTRPGPHCMPDGEGMN